MTKTVGLSRNIKLQWLNKAVELVEENITKAEFKQKLNEYLEFEIKSATNLRKTREILMHIWYYDEEGISDIREVALSLIKKYPDYAMHLHWCIMLAVYPVFADISKLVGRISEFKDEITLSQLKQKLFDEWGERATLFHSTDKIIATMKEMGALVCDKPGNYSINKHATKNTQIANFMLSVAMRVSGNSYYPFSELKGFGTLFPFEYPISKEQLMADERFVVNNFGGELTVAIKNV